LWRQDWKWRGSARENAYSATLSSRRTMPSMATTIDIKSRPPSKYALFASLVVAQHHRGLRLAVGCWRTRQRPRRRRRACSTTTVRRAQQVSSLHGGQADTACVCVSGSVSLSVSLCVRACVRVHAGAVRACGRVGRRGAGRHGRGERVRE
jgi:hypothetical protein